MLEIKNLHACIDGCDILKGLDLTLEAGKVHAIMGPNGAGKSTLSHVLAGREGYDVTAGTATLDGREQAMPGWAFETRAVQTDQLLGYAGEE